MSGFFQVDLDALRQFLTALHNADEQMHTALEAMKPDQAGSLGAQGPNIFFFGPMGLNQAADHFQHAWHYGMDQISKEVKETTEQVQGAYDAYQQHEDDAAKLFDQLRSLL